VELLTLKVAGEDEEMNLINEFSDAKKRPRTDKSKIKVLVVFANPSKTGPLRLGNEDRAIREAIRLSHYRYKIELDILHASTVHDLRRAFLDKEFHVVHISGHGTEDGLLLENDLGERYPVPQEALADQFSAYSPPLQCVILNACYSTSQGRLISLGVPFTIAVEGPISDKAAIEFSRGFYDAIGAGRAIDFAYEEGRRTVKLAAPNTQFNAAILKRDEASTADSIAQNSMISLHTSENVTNTHIISQISSSNLVQKKKEQLINEGYAYYKVNRFEEALAVYERAIELDPNYIEAYNNKGITLRALNRPKEALTTFERAIHLNPNFAPLYNGTGNVLLAIGHNEEALAAYERAIHLNPDFVDAHNNSGNALSALNRPAEALAAYERAIHLNPNFAPAYNGKGSVLRTLNRPEEALAAFEKAIQLNPNFVDAYINMGNAFGSWNQYEKAITAYERAIDLNPNNPIAYSNKGNLLTHIGRVEEAVQAYDKAKQLSPDKG
jgi:tetratricopeptide (TPR) repeat protein